VSLVVSAADPTVALNRILRGNHQQAVEAWVKIQPKLPGCTDALARAIRHADVEVMAFEYKRLEAFNRGIGALLNRIAAALDDLDAIAGDPEFASVQARAATHVHSLGAMKKTLVRTLQEINRLQARATKAIQQSRRRSSEFDADWERVQEQLERSRRTFEALEARMRKLHGSLVAARPLEPLVADDGFDEATKIVAAEPAASTLVPLRRELARIDEAVGKQATSPDFAVQFRNERPAFARQLERVDEASAYLHHTRHAIRVLKVDSRRPRG
jgi:hypothetical protein